MSLIGSLACVLGTLLWSLALLAEGLQSSPGRTFCLLTGGLLIIMVAAIRDGINDRNQ